MADSNFMLSRFSRPQFRKVALAAWHTLLRLCLPKSAADRPAEPKRILLINGAHIGDVVIATSLLPVLKSAFPNAEIGFLTGSWSHPVVRNHPLVDHTHIADHWRMNRSDAGVFKKRKHYWNTRQRALSEIRALSYDMSISMHPWRADFLPLAWQAGIPVRSAFSESLFAPLATATAEYPEHHRFIHQSECQAKLLRALGIAEEHLRKRRSSLAPSSPKAINEVCRLLGFDHIDEAPYSVIHMGAGSAVRELPNEFWRAMAEPLSANQTILFTGRGPRERANAAEVSQGLARCVNVCDLLSWDGFVAAIRHAHTLYSVDSMASHVAAAVGTKCIAMYAGMNNLARFRPEGENAIVWSNALPCSACGRQSGCAEMTCLKGLDPDAVLQIQKARAA